MIPACILYDDCGHQHSYKRAGQPVLNQEKYIFFDHQVPQSTVATHPKDHWPRPLHMRISAFD